MEFLAPPVDRADAPAHRLAAGAGCMPACCVTRPEATDRR
jgi:hypothetical protein